MQSEKPYEGGEKNLKFQRIMVMDCRGIDPIDFDPRVGV